MERTPLHDLSRDKLIGLPLRLQKELADLEKRNAELAARNAELSRRIEELEKKNPTVRLDEAYSMRAEEERKAKATNEGKGKRNKQKSKRRGRSSSIDKLAKATLEEKDWPKQFTFEECRLKYSRPVWRIINGQAVLVAYHIYAGPDGTVPQIPGVPRRCEFGQEICITLAHQHYIIGLSLDKAIAETEFFRGLKLRKSQNESERSLRDAAQDRRTGRTSKTELGARRRTIICCVLDSLRLHLPRPNLQAVQAEIASWYNDSVSCFRRMVASLKIPERSLSAGVESILDQLVPLSDTG